MAKIKGTADLGEFKSVMLASLRSWLCLWGLLLVAPQRAVFQQPRGLGWGALNTHAHRTEGSFPEVSSCCNGGHDCPGPCEPSAIQVDPLRPMRRRSAAEAARGLDDASVDIHRAAKRARRRRRRPLHSRFPHEFAWARTRAGMNFLSFLRLGTARRSVRGPEPLKQQREENRAGPPALASSPRTETGNTSQTMRRHMKVRRCGPGCGAGDTVEGRPPMWNSAGSAPVRSASPEPNPMQNTSFRILGRHARFRGPPPWFAPWHMMAQRMRVVAGETGCRQRSPRDCVWGAPPAPSLAAPVSGVRDAAWRGLRAPGRRPPASGVRRHRVRLAPGEDVCAPVGFPACPPNWPTQPTSPPLPPPLV